MINFFYYIIAPFQFISFSIESIIIQFFIIYLFYLIFTSKNIYYSLLYLFIQIVLFGLFIAFYQMELFTGFLWVVEGTVIFIALLLLFYLNVDSNYLKVDFKSINFYYIYILFFFFVICFEYNHFYSFDLYLPLLLNYIDLWEDYYESIFNTNMNDFLLLYISYYNVNSIEFLLIGFFLLIGSVVCVHLNKTQKNLKLQKVQPFFQVFNWSVDFINYVFMRKQNLNTQANAHSTLRIFKKKKIN